MQRTLASISFLVCLLFSTIASAQQHFPQRNGDKAEYNASITMQKGSMSGVCILVQDSDSIKGAVVNEFGVSLLDFVYNCKEDKVRLKSVIAMMDKWYIRKVLEADLRNVLKGLKNGKDSYIDEKYKINYTFTTIEEASDNNDDGTELPD